ncbi:MAG: hypothetical protein WCI75_19865 [candidate division NC10 bacterium]
MKRPPSFPSGRLVARPARLVGLVALLLIGGCPLQVMDPNAFQTGRVLKRGEGRLSGSTVAYAPARASVDVGLGRGWEAGAGYGYLVAWGRSGDLSVTRSLYSSRRLFSSVLLQAELARGFDSVPPLGRVTGAAALSYWPWEGVGLYVPLRLSMLFASPATFPYSRSVWNDSLGRYVHVQGERVFHGLHDPVFTAGFGFASEYKRFYSRLALTFPVIGPHIERDSVNEGFELLPYLGFQLGVRVF